jgi:histidinol-phosphate aminotransferase
MPDTKYSYPIVLDQNENHFPPSRECADFIKDLTFDYFSRYSRLNPSLKDKLSKHFEVDVNQVIIGQGAEGILKQAFQYLIKPGDKVLLNHSGWLYYQKVALEVEADVLFYHMIEGDDSFSYDIKEITNLLKENDIKLFFLTSPNNPTGSVLDQEAIATLFNFVDPATTYTILDEAYWGFVKPNYSFKDLLATQNILIIRTFSKLFALAGARVGFAFASEHWKGFVLEMSRYLGMPHVSEKLAMLSLDSWDYYQTLVPLFRKEADKYYDTLVPLGVKVFRTATNFIFAKLKQEHFKILKEQLPLRNIIIKFFDETKEPFFQYCIRISIGNTQENEFVIASIVEILQGQ